MHALSSRLATVLAAAALTLVTTACAEDATAGSPAPSPTPSVSTTSASPTTAAVEKPGLTPQGFLTKAIGQEAGTDCPADPAQPCSVRFLVTSMEVVAQCVEHGKPAPAGRKTLLLHVSLTTGTMSQAGASLAPIIFNPNALKGISLDGFVHDGQGGDCTAQDGRLPGTILPNSKYEGAVEVSVPESVTSIAATHDPGADGNRGWVWPVG